MRCWPFLIGKKAFDPATLDLTAWHSGPYPGGLPWAGTASIGDSANQPERVIGGFNPPTAVAGLNGINAAHYTTAASIASRLGSIPERLSDFISSTQYSFSLLARANLLNAPAGNAYENACFLSQQNGNPAWGIGMCTSGVFVWHNNGGYPGSVPVPLTVGAFHLIDGRYGGGTIEMRVDRGAWVTGTLPAALNLNDTMDVGKNSYNNASPTNADVLERWLSKGHMTDDDFNGWASWVNAKYGTAF